MVTHQEEIIHLNLEILTIKENQQPFFIPSSFYESIIPNPLSRSMVHLLSSIHALNIRISLLLKRKYKTHI